MKKKITERNSTARERREKEVISQKARHDRLYDGGKKMLQLSELSSVVEYEPREFSRSCLRLGLDVY